MNLQTDIIHPEGEANDGSKRLNSELLEIETYDGNVFVEWDPDAAVTLLAQLPFFIDSARRALKKIDETSGVDWLQTYLRKCYEPLLGTPWILDCDVTVKPLYGRQEGAVIGYNPHKPGRPSHTYMIGNLRLVLDVEVMAGNEVTSKHSMPGLTSLLSNLDKHLWPQFVRGDCD